MKEGGGESNIEYLDLSELEEEPYFASLIAGSLFVKAKLSSGLMEGAEVTGMTMGMFAMISSQLENINSICIDFTSILTQKKDGEIQSMTLEDMLISNGTVTKEQLAAIPRITEEEFYTLD